ncbi:MAG: glycosyltransferase family 2 protein [Myxococcota bacterium]|jgi:dolichol-phosphate mannosyltransferase|nr:glycosyltransferase family 2 protein [Myxococcota bacterium]
MDEQRATAGPPAPRPEPEILSPERAAAPPPPPAAIATPPARQRPRLSIVVPCYNEELNLPLLYTRLTAACGDHERELLFVDDASTDGTLATIRGLQQQDPTVRVISFVQNSGHQAALRAGLRHARGDLVISLDADLQHPPESIPAMIAQAAAGHDVVTMAHEEPQPGLFKQLLSHGFYRLFSTLSGVRLNPDASDFRLVTARVQQVINAMPEHNLFFRAVIPNLGFPQTTLTYNLGRRHAGKPAYTFKKSLTLALDALFAFSTFPIHLLLLGGIGMAVLAFLYGLVNVAFRLFTDINVPGFTDIVASVLFLGGMNLIMLSVISKYLIIIINHLKQRPEYVIDTNKSDPLG